MRFTTDCHVHTHRSACADMVDVPDYISLARQVGIERFAITDHSNDIYFEGEDRQGLKWKLSPSEMLKAVRQRSHRMDEYVSHVRQYRKMGVRVGIELEQMPLSGDFIFDWKCREKFDIVIGSVHSVPSIKKGVAADEDTAREEFLSLTLRALEQDIDILAHPTRSLQKAGVTVPGHYCDAIIDRAVARGIFIEINAHSRNPGADFLRRCIDRGAQLVLCTDSHSLDEFGDFSYHRKLFEDVGLKDGAARGQGLALLEA